MSEAQQLYDVLKKAQEPKGFFFNKDKVWALELLEALIVNKKRYGYTACPCRLASGERESDKDILCPCEYRTADVKEYGSCYCNLYVSRDWNEKKCPKVHVPERRPPEKLSY